MVQRYLKHCLNQNNSLVARLLAKKLPSGEVYLHPEGCELAKL